MKVSGRELTEYKTVQLWMAGPVDSMQARLRRHNLRVLSDFCVHRNIDPDAMIAAAATRDAKNDFMRVLKNWVKTYVTDERDRHDAENAVRSFFIANGLRVITKPYSDVYHRPNLRDAPRD